MMPITITVNLDLADATRYVREWRESFDYRDATMDPREESEEDSDIFEAGRSLLDAIERALDSNSSSS